MARASGGDLQTAVDPEAGPGGVAGDEGAVDEGGHRHGGQHRVDKLALAAKCVDEAQAEVRPWCHYGVVAAGGENMDVVGDQLLEGSTNVLQCVAIAEEWLTNVRVDGRTAQRAVVLLNLNAGILG